MGLHYKIIINVDELTVKQIHTSEIDNNVSNNIRFMITIWNNLIAINRIENLTQKQVFANVEGKSKKTP